MYLEEINRQVKEIIRTNGKCPLNTLCDECVCQPLLEYKAKGCNPANAVDFVNETFIKIVNEEKNKEEKQNNHSYNYICTHCLNINIRTEKKYMVRCDKCTTLFYTDEPDKIEAELRAEILKNI